MSSNQSIGRNDQCPCGSGKKYKKCCLGKRDFSIKEALPPQLLTESFPQIAMTAQPAIQILSRYRESDAFFAAFCMNAWANNRSVIEASSAINKALSMMDQFGEQVIDDYDSFCVLANELIQAYPISAFTDYINNDFGQVKIWFFDRYYPVLLGTGHEQVFAALHFLPKLSELIDKTGFLKKVLKYWESIYNGLVLNNSIERDWERKFECPSKSFFLSCKAVFAKLCTELDDALVESLGNEKLPIERVHFITKEQAVYPLFNSSILIDTYVYFLSQANNDQIIRHINYTLYGLLSSHYDVTGELPPRVLFPVGIKDRNGKASENTLLFMALCRDRVLIAINEETFAENELETELNLLNDLHRNNLLQIVEKKLRSGVSGSIGIDVPVDQEIDIIVFNCFTDITQMNIQIGEKNKKYFKCTALDLLYMLLLADTLEELALFISGAGQDGIGQIFGFGGKSAEFLTWKLGNHLMVPGAVNYDMFSLGYSTEDTHIINLFRNDFRKFPFEVQASLFGSPFAWRIKGHSSDFMEYSLKEEHWFGGYGIKLNTRSFIYFSHNARMYILEDQSRQTLLHNHVIDDINTRTTYRYREVLARLTCLKDKFINFIILPIHVAQERMDLNYLGKLEQRYVYSEILADSKTIRIRYVVNCEKLTQEISLASNREVECKYFCELLEPLANLNREEYKMLQSYVMNEANLPKQVDVASFEIDYYVSNNVYPYGYTNKFLSTVQKQIAQKCFDANIREGQYKGQEANKIIRAMQDSLINAFEDKVQDFSTLDLHRKLLSYYASLLHEVRLQKVRLQQFETIEPETLQAIREETISLREKARSLIPTAQLLLETNLAIQHTGNKQLSKDDMTELLTFSDRLNDLFRCADVCFFNETIQDLELKIDRDYLVYVNTEVNSENQIRDLERRKYQNEDYVIRSDVKDKEYLEQVVDAFKEDTGIPFMELMDLLDFLSLGFSNSTDWEECEWNVYQIQQDELINKFLEWAEEDISYRAMVERMFEFLIMDCSRLKFHRGEIRNYIPINEREQRDTRIDVRPLVKIEDDIVFSPVVIRMLAHEWMDGLLDFLPPYEIGINHVTAKLEEWRKRYQDLMVQDIKQLFVDAGFCDVRTEVELFDIDSNGAHPKDLGDYDVFAVNGDAKELWIIESKMIKKIGSVYEDQMQQKNFFQQNRYDEKFQRRIDYMYDHYNEILSALGYLEPEAFSVVPYMVINKIFASRYKEIKFPIISYSELRMLLNKPTRQN